VTWDAPNQQAVGQPPPWEEGTGGATADADLDVGDELGQMTKNDLLAYAEEHGVDVNAQMNKDDLKAAIRAAG
jgi:hypothetical protein